MKVALTIAGSDPTGGSGLQADLATFSRFKVHGAAVVSSLTIQNTVGIQEVVKIPSELLRKQMTQLLEDLPVDAAKTGILLDAETIEVVCDLLDKYPIKFLVVDPIIRSSTGYWILKKDELDALKKNLLPRAYLLTPNLAEAEALTGLSVRTEKEMERAGREIKGMGPKHVLIKGGHLEGPAVDILVGGRKPKRYQAQRIHGKRPHGAGCAYSAGITAGLARGMALDRAVAQAKAHVHRAIRSSQALGKGRHLLDLNR